MQDFYQVAVFMQSVIYTYWRMKHLTNAGSSYHRNTKPGQALKQVDVVKKGSTKLLGSA